MMTTTLRAATCAFLVLIASPVAGQVTITVDGSWSTPALNFTNDTSTGLLLIDPGRLGVAGQVQVGEGGVPSSVLATALVDNAQLLAVNESALGTAAGQAIRPGAVIYSGNTSNEQNAVLPFGASIAAETGGAGDSVGAQGLDVTAKASGTGDVEALVGGGVFVWNSQSSTVGRMWGLAADLYSEYGDVNEMIGFLQRTFVYGGEVTANYGVYIHTPDIDGGAITTNTALYVEEQTGATNNWAIYVEGGASFLGDSVDANAYKAGGVSGVTGSGTCTITQITGGIVTGATCM